MWWSLQRVKDRDDFIRRVNRPLPGMKPTQEQVQADMDAFKDFAAVFGAKPALTSPTE